MFAYQLAVVVDDAYQRVTEIVRGMDLLHSTARQIWLQNCLGLAMPDYIHIPVVTGSDGKKLSKSSASEPVRMAEPSAVLRSALIFLGHAAPNLDLASTWNWALEHWSVDQVPRGRSTSCIADKA
jgi:glutamyl-Q tRNA(Asp) synthetase